MGALSISGGGTVVQIAAPLNALADGKGRDAMRLGLNHTKGVVRTQVVRTLTTQTGLKRKVIDRAVRDVPASGANLSIVLRTHGGNVALKYFGARETRAGVSAAPWGRRQVFAHTFIKGGRFPGRVALNMGGQVFERDGSRRLPIKRIKSGLFIPEEMVTGATKAAWLLVVEQRLMPRIERELGRILGG